METLKIIYYIDMETDKVKPFVQEESASGKDYAYIKGLVDKIDRSNLLQSDKEKTKFIVNASNYLNLMKKGHSYEEIINLLRSSLNIKLETARKNTIIGLREELTLLEFAYQEKETILECMSNLDSRTIVIYNNATSKVATK